jgi:hypothetical protein
MGVVDKAAKTNSLLSLAEKFWAFLKFIGFDGPAKWAIGLGAGAIWSWYVTLSVPTWLVILTTLAVVTLVANLYVKWKAARLLVGMKSFDVREFGDECLRYYKEFAAMMSSLQSSPFRAGNDGADMHAQWQAQSELSRKRDRLALEHFGPRAYAIAHQMKLIGIPPPNLAHFPHGGSGGVAIYIAMVGELLKLGRLEEAKKLNPNDTWSIAFMH